MEKIIMEHTFFDDLFRDEIIVIDLGACKGEFSNTLDQIYSIKKLILVEANPTNFKQLEGRKNYILYNNIITNSDGVEEVFFEDLKSPYNGSKIFNYFNGVSHKIKTISLKKIIEDNNLEYIDLLKIDIEGSEYELLENLSDDIYSKINQITVEFHDFVDNNLKTKTKNIIEKLNILGYKHKSKPIKYLNNSENYDVIFYK